MKKVADLAAYSFIFAVVVLSAIAIFGVWDFLSSNVITKSFQSIGLLALVAVIVLIADHLMDQRGTSTPASMAVPESPQSPTVMTESHIIFRGIRKFTLFILILSVVLLALLGIMAIWEVLSGGVLEKSLSSIAIVAFSSLVIVVTCLERENNPILTKKKISGGAVVLVIVLMWALAAFLF